MAAAPSITLSFAFQNSGRAQEKEPGYVRGDGARGAV